MEDQQTHPQPSQLDNFFNIAFDDGIRAQVRSAASWAKICAICAFITSGIALLVALFGRQAESENFGASGLVRAGNVLGAVLVAAISVFINYFLYRFATATTKGMNAMDIISTNEGFNSLRTYFKILGIILIIVLSLAAIVFLFALITVASRLS
jgi:hypothetical protein